MAVKVIKPQPGPQEQFLSSPADIVIYGGSAGGGKTFAALMEPLRHVTRNPGFFSVYFRRQTTQIKNPGGLWDTSMQMYPAAGGTPISHVLEWKWPKGGKIKMAHIEHEKDMLSWQGSQIPLIIFDELTHFLETQFWYLLSRNRDGQGCGVRPYVRATTNPDADSWVRKFIDWWIGGDGYAIPERSGKIRWMCRVSDEVHWANSEEELIERFGDDCEPLSVTFILSRLKDNAILNKNDPKYKATLKAMTRVQRERLLGDEEKGGNWNIRPASGMYFKRHEVDIIDRCPTDVVRWVRAWDLAATEPSETNPDPDGTAGVLMGIRPAGTVPRFIVAHCISEKWRADKVRKLVKRTAAADTDNVKIRMNQDPGQAGKEQAESYVRDLAGYKVTAIRESGDKITRAEPFSAQWQAGNVAVLRGAWNDHYFNILEAFGGDNVHDDEVDASSSAFNDLQRKPSIYEVDDDLTELIEVEEDAA
jgi:predicted phage terminase large subunit-like protein